MDLNGQNIEALTTDDARHWYYGVDHENSKIYYLHWNGGALTYRMDLDGSNKQHMTWAALGMQPTDARNGKVLLYNFTSKIYMVDVSTGNISIPVQDSTITVEKGTLNSNASKIAYTRHSGFRGGHLYFFIFYLSQRRRDRKEYKNFASFASARDLKKYKLLPSLSIN